MVVCTTKSLVVVFVVALAVVVIAFGDTVVVIGSGNVELAVFAIALEVVDWL